MGRSRKRNRKQALSNRQASHITNEIQAYQFSGPLPDPSTLQQYNEILPGSAERIIAMAESQADHRQAMENKVVKRQSWQSMGGLISGFIIALFGLGISGFLIYAGKEVGGSILGGGTLVSLVSVFVIGKRETRLERESKWKYE